MNMKSVYKYKGYACRHEIRIGIYKNRCIVKYKQNKQ